MLRKTLLSAAALVALVTPGGASGASGGGGGARLAVGPPDHVSDSRRAAHTPLPPLAGEADGKIIRTKVAGPAGWNRAILKLTHR